MTGYTSARAGLRVPVPGWNGLDGEPALVFTVFERIAVAKHLLEIGATRTVVMSGRS